MMMRLLICSCLVVSTLSGLPPDPPERKPEFAVKEEDSDNEDRSWTDVFTAVSTA